MTAIFAEQALLPGGWHANVRIATDGGTIAAVEPDSATRPGDERHAIVVPGMANLHSHAFQRGMAGLAETRGPGADSFWSWREVMYRFALTMTPEQVEAVAAQLYVEMLEQGFSRVGEFHYLHHDRDGRPYANVAEMAERIAAAASETGIGLTLLPVFYAHSSFGGAVPNEGQRRFINDINMFSDLLEGSRKAVRPLHRPVVGVAPHSLRAVTPARARRGGRTGDRARSISTSPSSEGGGGLRRMVRRTAVEWLMANAAVDARWCLIHATHMTEAETGAMRRSGAVAASALHGSQSRRRHLPAAPFREQALARRSPPIPTC